MATVAGLPSSDDLSFEYTLETVERWAKAGPTDDEILDFLEQAIKDLGEPGNVEIFRAAMEELGKRATQTAEAFYRVKTTMSAFLVQHWLNFPGIFQFHLEWNSYMWKWRVMISTSQYFAIKSSVEYQVYTQLLQRVDTIETKEELDALANTLKQFATNIAIGVPIDFKDKFLALGRDVVDFQKRFNAYLDQQGVELETKAKALRADIESLKVEIAGLDKQIKSATTALKIASFFGPFGAAIAGSALAALSKKRSNKQKDLDGKRAELQRVEALQSALGKIKAQFASLVPDFELLTDTVNLFADTWNAFHNEAVDFATKFKSLEKPDALPELYKRKIRLALAVSDPLSRGLIDYASAIHW